MNKSLLIFLMGLCAGPFFTDSVQYERYPNTRRSEKNNYLQNDNQIYRYFVRHPTFIAICVGEGKKCDRYWDFKIPIHAVTTQNITKKKANP